MGLISSSGRVINGMSGPILFRGRALTPFTLTLQPDGTAGLDARILVANPTTNQGTATILAIGTDVGPSREQRTAINFDFSGLPDGAIITSATLSLYCDADLATSSSTFEVFRFLVPWVESQITWNIRSTGNNWATAGGFGAADCEQTRIGYRVFSASETLNQFKDFPLTATTKAELSTGYGYLIKSDLVSADLYQFASSETTTAANRPKLVINYLA